MRAALLASAALLAAAASSPPAPAAPRPPALRPLRSPANAHLFEPLPAADAATLARAAAARRYRRAPARGAFCEPADACWPTAADFAALSAAVGGRLLAPLRPEGAACFPDASSPACTAVVGNWTDPYWRARQPGAMQRPFWEADRTTGANCYTLGSACAQGAVPPVGVAAASAADVAAALAFAARFNLRVAVKSSGHEIQGRSTAAGALLIWLAGLRGVALEPAFAACAGDAPVAAVSAGPGDSYGDLYARLDPAAIVVGGSARTVSAAGGHPLGGGHSFVSPHYGLAADNLLAVEAVLANGTIVRASACENADLFWALRGGGGGSFAVVTSATHRVHATPPAVAGALIEVQLLQGLASVALWLDGALALTPALTNASANAGRGIFGGYHNVQPVDAASFVFVGIWGFNGTAADARASLGGFQALIDSAPAHFKGLRFDVSPFASWEAWHASFDPVATGDRTGDSSTIGCRFVPAAFAADAARRANATAALTAVARYAPLLGHLVVGGAVAAFDADSTRTSVTPAWRAAAWHTCTGVGWAMNATIQEQDAAFAAVSTLTGIMRDAIPDSGAYWGESDYLEPDWQAALFGNNYARLQRVKAAVDPAGAFGCWHCVEAA